MRKQQRRKWNRESRQECRRQGDHYSNGTCLSLIRIFVVDLGGRVSEELVFDDITTGVSQDIKQATKLAREMVTKYGMSDNIGLICYADDEEEATLLFSLGSTLPRMEYSSALPDFISMNEVISRCM